MLENNMGIVEDFKNTYMSYCDLSNNQALKKVYSDENIKLYIKNKCILITKAEFLNGKVYHLYVWSENDSVLVYSASDYRNKNVDRNLAARSNKLLHYKDICYFKDNGLKIYDFGNISSIDEPNGIDKFKISFGGSQINVYSYFVGNTLWGRLLILCKKILNSKGNKI